jgi:hypothetical protein
MKARGRARHNLVRASSTDFQREVIGLLSEVLEGSTESKRLGHLDRKGVDIYTYSPDDLTIELALQCKGFEVEQYGPDQHRQCRDEIKKYKLMGPSAPSYWLVLNRPITERSYRDELLNDLEDLRRSGKVSEALLLDLDPFMTKVQALAIRRLAAWAKDRRSELFEYYNERLRFTDYLPEVPFTVGIPARNPVEYIARRVTEFFSKLPPHQTGRYRPSPKLLITSSFGFGKTSTLHAVAGEWVRAGGQLLYVPAAFWRRRPSEMPRI